MLPRTPLLVIGGYGQTHICLQTQRRFPETFTRTRQIRTSKVSHAYNRCPIYLDLLVCQPFHASGVSGLLWAPLRTRIGAELQTVNESRWRTPVWLGVWSGHLGPSFVRLCKALPRYDFKLHSTVTGGGKA